MAKKRKVGWGVIGACGIAQRRTIPEGIMPARNAKLIAITDVDHARAASLARKLKTRAVADTRALLATPGVDAVYIATPNNCHKPQTLAAARAGKHVLCEKPLAVSTRDIRAMISACKKARVKLGTGFMMRFNVYHQALKEMIKKRAFGKPVMARGQMTCWYPRMKNAWRQVHAIGGGGAMVDMGSHVIDVMEMLFGKVVSVSAVTANRSHKYEKGVEDTCIALYKFASGVPAVLDISWGIPDEVSEFVFEFYGSTGAVKGNYSLAQGPGGNFRICQLGNAGGYDAQQAVKAKGGYANWKLKTKNTYQAEIEAFSRAIIEGKPAPVSGKDGLWNHLVMEATYKAAETGMTVKLRKLKS